ncbi:MAG: tetratricopeptide repeat protein [Blastocatellales bacterium]
MSKSLSAQLPTARLILTVLILYIFSITASAFQLGAITPNSGFVVFGRVSLPNGRPAKKVKVFIEASSGMKRDTITNEEGNYEFRGMTTGRFRVYAVNPDAPDQYTDPAESDSTRSYANRLQIDLYLRLPLNSEKDALAGNPGTISVAEASQNIPKTARKAYDQGMKLQKDNHSEQAIVQFNQAIELYPEYFQALTERANLLMLQNKLAEAEADFVKALQINDKYTPALRGLGSCQIQQGTFAAAVSNLEKAFVLEPGSALTLFLLGYGNLSLNRYEEAKQCLQQALKIGKGSVARAHVYLAEVYAHEQKFKEAADELRQYLSSNPQASDAPQLTQLESQWRARSKTKN